MPNYDYRCADCGFQEEVFQKMSEAHLTTCPKCRKETYRRQFGAGSGLMFKGTGFYETDYKNPPSQPQSQSKCCPCGKGTGCSSPPNGSTGP